MDFHNANDKLPISADDYSEVLQIVLRSLRARAKGIVEPEDVVQSIFASLADHFAHGRVSPKPSGNFREWLLDAARRHVAKHNKRSVRERRVPLPSNADGTVIEPPDPSAESDDDEELAAGFESLVKEFEQKLSSQQFKVLQLRFVDGMKISDVAERLGVVVGTINRSIKKIKETSLTVYSGMELTDD